MVSVIIMSMTEKTEGELERVPYIWYPVTFKDQTEALLDSKSEVNTMSQTFVEQLGLKICKTNVGDQKIDGTTLETYGIVVFTFSISNKDGMNMFFEVRFILADIKPNIVPVMLFLTIINANIDFQAWDL